MNKVNDISKINENSVSLSRAKFEMTFPFPFHLIEPGDISRISFPLFWSSPQIAIAPQKSPMSLSRPIQTNASYANVAQR
jgi:hypothetical protein